MAQAGSASPLFAVVLAAGKGTRMKSNRAKVLHTLCGVPMVNYVIGAIRPLVPERLLVVVGHQAEQVRAVLPEDAEPVLQPEQRGTGDAVRVALEAIPEEEGVLLVVNGDGPLISDRTLGELLERHRSAGVGATVLVAELPDPSGLGRVREDAGVVRITEERDATEAERRNRLCNLGLYAFELPELRRAIREISSGAGRGELYLTDVLEIIGRRSRAVTYRLKDLEEANLVNDRSQLARAEEILRRRILDAHMKEGVTVRDPVSTHIEASVEIGRDTVILPGTFLRGRTRIGSDCVIGPSTDLVDTVVEDGATVEHSVGRGARVGRGAAVGPYAYLRPGTVLEEGSKVGAFCEVKNTRVGARSKVPHLSYVGDAEIGEDANLGAGTITANYDGAKKHRTVIEDGAFTGINTNLIAPVTIGQGAYLGAGSVVNKDIPPGKLAVGAPARVIRDAPGARSSSGDRRRARTEG
ncbi:glucosamine-1-phosphate N-acetyltransferase / UDP-N-acetylglucosamine pyrophosphorylase [Rubrobacter xylanophilus DSM 9941]|uniref:Bifunctional protein GlmU n=1 Tax=Rubrobacter xylanophilus (strain DSM 9941 / JCM 11954 / NBRC 16129 / PRD-1) TaxID=266117 RepID=GLMU_RUBXD|nr:bifunctional UDP-N-acetylglucosamine diphosphorylase/glucosamine-1-phosphate N-acetyltransferase GlmU [Rubrobacter xylanophilus]Q1AXL7.1 RecName: Full=Bifunctional protein GlmU; Includes: RecName: Full=UDP-N-acetylglucosamine pyrophosphorylase; AltName: Full=N-acetylglucosamine-1-phosphate uridyltransferase; Includes: RecName: Full=Glucosamine-1-phosphate N-acetyltransferase [Rubrobacter xylanophilus DSM 9941]ABG03861.1 glucosamine-1-phosphate N-acetyltransferase / UDP-N-acetylglucosamine pyro